MKEHDDYYEMVVKKVKAGEQFGLWNKLIKYVSELSEQDARLNYPDLYYAMKKQNLCVWKGKETTR